MKIQSCPICGRYPKITELPRYKNNIRRRVIGLACWHDCVYEIGGWHKTSYFIYNGDGDDNAIWREWNYRTTRMQDLPWDFRDMQETIYKEDSTRPCGSWQTQKQ